MRKIAVFTSGEAAAAARLITLFNEGNRIRVDVVVTDDDPSPLEERFKEYGVDVIGITPESSPEELVEIGKRISGKEVELYAFEGYDGLMSGWVKERFPDRIVELSSADEAPREVVAAFAAHDKGVEEQKKSDMPKINKTVDEEWAETLQIDFDSKRADEAAKKAGNPMQTPPPVPGRDPQLPPVPPFVKNPQYSQSPIGGTPRYQGNDFGNRPVNDEPMPPTYLVWSVIMTVLCCLVPGIVAIIFSAQVSSKYYSGDMEGAKRASRNAEIWIIVSFVLGVLSATLYLPIMMVS